MAYCTWITTTDPKTGEKITALVRMTGRAPGKCHVCGIASSKLCDFKAGGRTCNKRLCDRCAVSIAKDVDYCPEHPK